ncbi:nucleoside-diphosphate kinase [Glaesserella parasuis]|uniref:Nucleoside diphosphate kinase n=2 Tax=Glaesserella parasuis TaxID=738 RepID=A0A143CER5_GLAPU|nr:nucleoside-diphosphate kinase [Glaesserella parasuis]EQA04364.1 nucleoside diphosphate kinase [Glaesserella parasuis MN-H]AMW15943.1 nucleoside-diphosphate kinase [Glaesserella parasuis]KDB44753.1 nucleoside diphosphate kinase [Glaesserella parasuis HPS11]KDD78430.1 nucleoside diphosphate kinase [Glaesserella parasuis ST4-1]MCT8517766.1 nucleoside-diphosphate kinase [Glaesserella parasuis]
MIQQTLAIIKPDATKRHLIGEILSYMEKNGLAIKALKMLHLTKEQAEGFYAEHQGKDFFDPLVAFMISEPIVVAVLEGENAVENYRLLMGATKPEERKLGTIRKMFGLGYCENSVHGSDSETSAKREIAYFFTPSEIV